MAQQAASAAGGGVRGMLKGAGKAVKALLVISIGGSLYFKYRQFQEYVTLPAAFYLELDLEQQALVERQSSDPLQLVRMRPSLELQTLIQALHQAKNDDRVRGMMTLLGDRENFGGMAQLQELRNALLDFRFHAKGRAPIYAYSNVFGEGGMNATALYYLASAADKVFMPPTSCLSLLGVENTTVFYKHLLDRFKVQPEVFRREEYKSFMAPFTNTTFDAAHRENITSLLQSLYSQVVDGIAAARRLSPAAVQGAINAAPLLPQAAIAAGLLDGLLYRDQVAALLVQQLPPEHQTPQVVPSRVTGLPTSNLGPRVPLQRYLVATSLVPLKAAAAAATAASQGSSGSSSSVQQAAVGANAAAVTRQDQHQQGAIQQQQQFAGPQKPVVAVVTAAGGIMQSAGPAATGDVVESNKLVRALRSFRENPQVKAVVLRINSPGGSAVASDMIAREVQLLRAAGKPVIACMGDVAASGGYYIAAPATKILAQPATITGSIGVIFAKFNVQEALREFGVTGASIKQGDNADWASPFQDLTTQQRQQIESMMDATYGNFLAEVARGRGLTPEAVRLVAKGRVWTGSQALEAGLVDELGGVTRAVELAKQLSGLPDDPKETTLVEWPPRRVPAALMLLKSLGGSQGQQEAVTTPAAMAGGAFGWLADAAAAAAGVLGLFGRFLLADLVGGGSSHAFEQPPLVMEAAAAGASSRQSSHESAIAAIAAAAGGGSPQQQLAQRALLQLLLQQASRRSQQQAVDMLCLEAVSLAYSC